MAETGSVDNSAREPHRGTSPGMAKNRGKGERTPQQKSASRAQSSADKNPTGELARSGGHSRIQSSADRQAAASRKSAGRQGRREEGPLTSMRVAPPGSLWRETAVSAGGHEELLWGSSHGPE
jgi:hypothetical protein